MKKNLGWKALGVIILGLMVFGFILKYEQDHPNLASASAASSKTAASGKSGRQSPLKQTDAISDYVQSKPNGTWNFTAQDVQGENWSVLDVERDKAINSIEKAFKTYATVPEVKNLADKFSGKMYISYYSTKAQSAEDGGASLVGHSEEDIRKYGNPGFLEICLYDQEHSNDRRMVNVLVHYDSEWKAVLLPGLSISEPWLSGLTLHEIYHAYMHRIGAPSATGKYLSDSFINEELGAHDMERGILDLATKGKYLSVMNKIAASRAGYKDADQVTASFTKADLESLDGMFAVPSVHEASVRAAQYYLDLASLWLAKKYSGDNLTKERIVYYRSRFN